MSKDNGIVKGGFISSLSLFLTKFLGIIYVIPLNMILATSLNRDYYSVGFRVYEIILSISISGFPIAVATLVSRYEAQGNYEYARLAKKYGGYVLSGFGFMMMLLLLVFANSIAAMIKNPAPIEEIYTIATMIRILAVAVYIVSILGSFRGFYQGIKKITTYSFSQFIEQVIRISIIVISGYFFVDILKFDRVIAVYITAIAAGVSAFIAYILLWLDYRKNYKIAVFEGKDQNELRKQMILETIRIAIPYMTMSLLAYATSIIELSLFSKVFASVGFDLETRKQVFTAITMQGEKLSTIPLVIATGFSVAVLPYLNESLAQRNFTKLRQQIIDVISTVILVGVPLCMGIVLFTRPIFHIFFGNTAPDIGVGIVRATALLTITTIVLNICVSMSMAINVRKYVLITYLFAILTKLAWYYPTIVWFGKYGPIISSFISNVIQIILILGFLKIRFKINFSIVYRRSVVILFAVVLMSIFGLIHTLIPISYRGLIGVLIALTILFIFGTISIIIYAVIVNFFKLPQQVLGINIIDQFLQKLKRKKNEN